MDEDNKIIEGLRENNKVLKAQIRHLEKSLNQSISDQQEVKMTNNNELQKAKEFIDDLNRKVTTSNAFSAAFRLRRSSCDINSPNWDDELLPSVLADVSDLVFFLGRSLPGGRGLASGPNSSWVLTGRTCSSSVKSTGANRRRVSFGLFVVGIRFVRVSLKIGFVVVVFRLVVGFVVGFGFVEIQEKLVVKIQNKLVARESSELG
nr:hypothetical protein [Tanacetum cinerariifolium]